MPNPSPQLADALSRYQAAVRRLNAAVELGADRDVLDRLILAKNQAHAALRDLTRSEDQRHQSEDPQNEEV